MQCQILFSRKNKKKNIISLSSTESAHSVVSVNIGISYRIRPTYLTCPYKRTVKRFRSLQITVRVLFVYFFLKAYVVGNHLNYIDLSMEFKLVPTTYAFIKKKKKIAWTSPNKSLAGFFSK